MSRVTVPACACLLLVPRERLRVSAPQAGPAAGVLNVLRTHSEPCHSDHSPYLANSGGSVCSLGFLANIGAPSLVD